MTNKGTSYLLWTACFLGFAGIHRLYNGKIATGILWFCTWGIFGVGQFIDLLLIPEMVDEHNAKFRARLGKAYTGILETQPTIQLVLPQDMLTTATANGIRAESETNSLTKEQLMIQLIKAAQARGGKLSVTQGVLDTSCGFTEVETTLKDMVKSGYVTVCNDPNTGIVLYDFVEL
jgi:TM2 domain-containing membrane protein YozV